MQSLLPSIYPMLKQTFGLSFRQIGLITLVSQITASLLQPVIGVYTDRRPQPHSLAVGMAFTLVGMMLLGFGPELRRGPHCRRAHRSRLCRLPSRVVSNRAARVGRTPRICAGILPGGRKRRVGGRAAARCVSRAAVRTTQHRVVFADGAAGNYFPVECRQLVQADRCVQSGRRRHPGEPHVAHAAPDTRRARPADGADLFEVHLSRQLRQLLHVLSDEPLQPPGAERADSSVPVSRRGRRGNDFRRTHRRSVWKAPGHPVVDPRRAALFTRASLRRSVLDARALDCRSA